jgi:hypothetical protein
MSKRQKELAIKSFGTCCLTMSEIRMFFLDGLSELFTWLVVYCFPTIFIFLLIITVGMKERDTKLKFREIMQGLFKRIF